MPLVSRKYVPLVLHKYGPLCYPVNIYPWYPVNRSGHMPLVPRMNLWCEWEMSILVVGWRDCGETQMYPLLPCKYMAMHLICSWYPAYYGSESGLWARIEYIVRRRDCRGAGLCADVCARRRASYHHLANTCKQSNTPLSHPTPHANPPPTPPPPLQCQIQSYLSKIPSRVLQGPGFFPCSTFESFLVYVQTTLLNLLLQLLETKSGFKTNRILPLYSQELQFKIKHKVGKCTNNQQMSQLRYHCMPLRQPIRCTYTFHVTDFRCTYFVH